MYVYSIYIYIHMQGTHWGNEKVKAYRPAAPKMGPRHSAKPKARFKWCRDARAVLQQACQVNLDSHKHCKDICTASGSVQDPERNPRHPETSKLTYFRTAKQLHRESSTTGFCEWQRWFLGSGARFACAYPHTSRGSSVKFAIRIGLAAKLLRICSKATEHGAALRTGLAAKLLRMRSKATKDDFAIRTSPAAKLVRKCCKDAVSSPCLQVWGKFLIVFRPIVICNSCLSSSRELLNSFASKPLRFVPHAIVEALHEGIGDTFSESLGGPKTPKPEPQISRKARFSGMYPRSIYSDIWWF